MPLASWGSGSGDYSGLFASLADGIDIRVQQQAERLDARRESEQAGRDAEVYARYQAGQLSNEAWLAYIRQRKAETAYDKSQQANWIKADLEWSEKIEDDKAQARFEATNDYGGYIAYLNGKLDRTKDSSGRLEIRGQIRSLTDQRDQQNLSRGAQRIANQMELGKATPDDLLRFYRDQRANIRGGSPLRETIDKAIADTRAQIMADRFDSSMAKVDADLKAGDLTPVQAAKRKRSLVENSTLKITNPTEYYQLLDEANRLQYTPDPAKLNKLAFDLQTGVITPDEYQKAIYGMADTLMDYDPATAWQLRSSAWDSAQAVQAELDKEKIPNPGALKGYTGGGSGDFRWLSQMDGSQYQSLNCTTASGAMLAYAMGYKGLSGGDLRYLTGDTVRGTNIDQLYSALNKAGVDTSGMALNRSGDFEKFKQMIGNGRASVIVGNNANIPASAKAAAWMNSKHAWLVAEYDPKKDAFHIFNSAMSRSDPRSKNGYWVSSDIMQSFGFGQGVSGQWLASPKGTAQRVGKAWHVIDVDTPPQRKGTPQSYRGINNQGAAGNQKGAIRSKGDAKPLPENPKKSDIIARQEQDRKRLDQIDKIDAEDTTITPSMRKELDAERMRIYDENIHFSDAMEDFDGAAGWRSDQAKFIAGAKERNGDQVEWMFNTLIRNAAHDIANLQYESDPTVRANKIAGIVAGIQKFNDTKVVADPNDPLSGADPETDAKIQALTDAFTTAADPNVALEDKKDAIDEVLTATGNKAPGAWVGPRSEQKGDDIGIALTNTAGLAEDARVISSGEGEPVVVNGRVEVIKYLNPPPLRPDPLDPTKLVPTPVLDTSSLGDGTAGDQLPVVLIQTPSGPQPVRAVVEQKESGLFTVTTGKEWDGHSKGYALTNTDLAKLTPAEHQKLVDQGVLKDNPIPLDTITVPDTKGRDGSIIPGAVYVRDPGTRKWAIDHLPIEGVSGTAIPGVSNLVGTDPTTGEPQLQYQPRASVMEFDVPKAGNVSGKDADAWYNSPAADPYRTNVFRDDVGGVSDDPAFADYDRKYSPPTWAEQMTNNTTQQIRAWQAQRQEQAITAAKNVTDAVAAAKAKASGAIYHDNSQFDPSSPDFVDKPKTPDTGIFPIGDFMDKMDDIVKGFGVKKPAPKTPGAAVSNKEIYGPPAPDYIQPKPQPSRGILPENKKDPNSVHVGAEVLEPVAPLRLPPKQRAPVTSTQREPSSTNRTQPVVKAPSRSSAGTGQAWKPPSPPQHKPPKQTGATNYGPRAV